MEAGDIVVELFDSKNKNKEPLRKTIHHPGGTIDYPLEYMTALSEEGTHKLTVKVQPVKGLKESALLERSAETQVVKDQADVLVIDGEARWEYHYLTVALGRDKLIKEVRGVVFEQPRIERVTETELQRTNWPALKLPEDPAVLTGFDCIVLGDVPPDKLRTVRLTDRSLALLRTAEIPPDLMKKIDSLKGREFEDRKKFAEELGRSFDMEERKKYLDAVLDLPLTALDHLQAYVRDAGGTLVIVAGKQSMPLGYKKDVDATRPDPLAALLPITEPHIVNSRQGFPVTLTSEGRLNPLLQLSDKASDDDPNRDFRPERDIWAELPPHYWAVVGKKKPAATTLAYYPGERGEQPAEKPKEGNPKAVESKKAQQEANSLIAWHTFGRGPVLYVGLDSTWRWRYKVGDQHHHRFWGQLVRWAVNDKLLPGGSGKIRFGTPEPTYETGKDKEIDVRLRLDKSLPVPDAKTTVTARILRVLDGDKTAQASVVTLSPHVGQPRTLEGKVRDLEPGTYKIEIDFGNLGTKLGSELDAAALNKKAAEFIVGSPSNDEKGEMADLTADVALLQRLAILSRPELADLEKKLREADGGGFQEDRGRAQTG